MLRFPTHQEETTSIPLFFNSIETATTTLLALGLIYIDNYKATLLTSRASGHNMEWGPSLSLFS